MIQNLIPKGFRNSAKYIQLVPQLLELQQIRTTFILKRRYDPLLHKKNQNQKKLRAKHFIYDLVEDTLVKKQTNLEVVLTQYVEGIGYKGDIVSMKPNFVYNKLLLPGYAVYKTPENLIKYQKSKKDANKKIHSSPFAQTTVNKLESMILSVVLNKENSWKIEPWHIRTSLRKAGYYCENECITLPEKLIEGPDLKKENKEFSVIITINNLEKAKLRCRIHHWSTEPSERLPYAVEPWKEAAEPLFRNDEFSNTDPAR